MVFSSSRQILKEGLETMKTTCQKIFGFLLLLAIVFTIVSCAPAKTPEASPPPDQGEKETAEVGRNMAVR